MGTFLVSGAAGFIGSHLSERLIADGHRVIGVDAFTPYYERALKERNIAGVRAATSFEFHETDLATAELRDLCRSVDGIFHLAAEPGVRGSWGAQFDTYLRNNVHATQRLLEAVKDAAVHVPVVYASSSSIYGAVETLPVSERDLPQPVSPYGVTKLAGEHLGELYGRAFGMAVAAVRYFTVYGPRQRPDMAFTRIARAVLSGRRLEIMGDGSQSRDFTFVADAVDGTIKALGQRGRFNVGGGTVATLNEAIALFEDLAGARVDRTYGEVARGDVTHTWADTSLAQKALGWSPVWDLRSGIHAHLEWAKASD